MWQGRRVIVAGGTAGFGLVLGRHLARAGAACLLVGRSSAGVRAALERCDQDEALAAGVHGLAADLERPGEADRMAAEAIRILGGIDDVFCCVGRSGRAAILETSRDVLQGYLDANLLAPASITRAVANEVATARGHLVYIGSLAGKVVTPFMGPTPWARRRWRPTPMPSASNSPPGAPMCCSSRRARLPGRPTTQPPVEPPPGTRRRPTPPGCRRRLGHQAEPAGSAPSTPNGSPSRS